MMKIDGQDPFEVWKVMPAFGTLEALLAFPPTTERELTSWHERNGAEVSANVPGVEKDYTVTIPFNGYPVDFIDYLKSKPIHTIEALGGVWGVSLKAGSSVELLPLSTFRLTFTVSNTPYVPTAAPCMELLAFLSTVGCVPLLGTIDALNTIPEVKEYLSGQRKVITFSTFDFEVPVLMRIGKSGFQAMWSLLLSYLLQNGEIPVAFGGREIRCIYRRCNGKWSAVNGEEVFFEFGLTFTATSF